MKIPKTVRLYCKKCRKHSEHKLKEFKAGSPRALSWGTRQNIRRHKKGYGGKSEFPKTPRKQNKKPVFLAECITCHAKCYFSIPKRMKKVEIIT